MAIGQRILESTLATVLAGLLALIASALLGAFAVWWLSVTVPLGAVVAFDREDGCPSGWRRHDFSAGRFIVGVQDSPAVSDRAHSRFPGHALTPTGVMAIRCKQFHLPDL